MNNNSQQFIGKVQDVSVMYNSSIPNIGVRLVQEPRRFSIGDHMGQPVNEDFQVSVLPESPRLNNSKVLQPTLNSWQENHLIESLPSNCKESSHSQQCVSMIPNEVFLVIYRI